jgi:PASTA domain/Regulator of chromosome condensation (RCC1) repeat
LVPVRFKGLLVILRTKEDTYSSDSIPTSSWRIERSRFPGGGKEQEIKVLMRPGAPVRFCALALLSVGLLLAPGVSGATRSTAPGTVVAWGCGGNYGACDVPRGLPGVVTATAAGWVHSLALKSDGTVVAWGCGSGNDYGQCSVPGGLSGVTAIAAGSGHNLALVLPASCRVPNVVGKRLASAKRTIAQRHCRTGKVSFAYSLKRKKGTVISQSRRPGRVLPARSKINLVVSRGRRR